MGSKCFQKLTKLSKMAQRLLIFLPKMIIFALSGHAATFGKRQLDKAKNQTCRARFHLA